MQTFFKNELWQGQQMASIVMRWVEVGRTVFTEQFNHMDGAVCAPLLLAGSFPL